MTAAGAIIRLGGVQLDGSLAWPAHDRLRGARASIGAAKTHELWTLAAVIALARGMPPRSTTPGRVGPDVPRSVGFGSVAGPFCRWDASRVQRRPRPVNGISFSQPVEQDAVQTVPHARPLPLAQPPPARDAAAVAQLGGQQLPGDTTLQHEQDAHQRRPVVESWTATLRLGRLQREERRDHLPQFIRYEQFRHTSSIPDAGGGLLGALSL